MLSVCDGGLRRVERLLMDLFNQAYLRVRVGSYCWDWVERVGVGVWSVGIWLPMDGLLGDINY